jgi:hypothetical protein
MAARQITEHRHQAWRLDAPVPVPAALAGS